MSALL